MRWTWPPESRTPRGPTTVLEDAAQAPFGMSGAHVPAFPVESDPGDVVLFSEDLWHGSFGGRAGRRMFTLIYYENPKTAAQIEYLKEFHSRTIAMFHPHDRFLNSDRPRVQGMVEKYVELGLV